MLRLRTFATLASKMRVVPVPARADNYMYLLISSANKAAAVDPYDVPKITAAAEKEGVDVVAVLTTHHHHDHSGGNKEFVKNFPGTPVYGGSEQCDALTDLVADGTKLSLADTLDVQCVATPCHTQDSICYFVQDKNDPEKKAVFTGDTLFLGGCGRFFEGSAAEMHAALSKLGALPDDTVVYVGHEYTAGNAAFARSVDPYGAGIARLTKLADEKVTTGKSNIADEKEWNVFMRLATAPVQKATGETETSKVMEKLREMKNSYRG